MLTCWNVQSLGLVSGEKWEMASVSEGRVRVGEAACGRLSREPVSWQLDGPLTQIEPASQRDWWLKHLWLSSARGSCQELAGVAETRKKRKKHRKTRNSAPPSYPYHFSHARASDLNHIFPLTLQMDLSAFLNICWIYNPLAFIKSGRSI